MAEDQDFMEKLRIEFLDEVTFLLEDCDECYLKLEDADIRSEQLDKIFRLAHSMKGAGAAVGYTDLSEFAHRVEDSLSILRAHPHLVTPEIISLLLECGDAFKNRIDMFKRKDPAFWDIDPLKTRVKKLVEMLEEKKNAPSDEGEAEAPVAKENTTSGKSSGVATPSVPATTASIKIDAERIENVLDLVGELVVTKSQLTNQTSQYSADLKLNAIVSLMEKTIRELQDSAMSMRMTPLKGLFLKTQRIVRDLSIKLNKPIQFSMSGEDTEIDRTMVELLSDPLLHIARNSLDHGIEKQEARLSRNKPAKGSIHLSAQQVGARVIVKISDDGGGINRGRIIKKAIEKGIIAANRDPSTLNDRDVVNLIFAPGFSTAEKVTDVSGRGVGMDVVKTNIEKLKGVIDVETEEGKGTTLKISIPLTTAITDGMIILVGDQRFILPIDSIKELVTFNPSSITEIQANAEVFNYRGTVLPVLCLRKLLCQGASIRSQGLHPGVPRTLAVIETSHQMIALELGEVKDHTQVVLKPLGPSFENIGGISGTAILGDGKVALVLDPQGLADRIQNEREVEGLLDQSRQQSGDQKVESMA